YSIGAAASGVGGIQPLALAFDFDVAEMAGNLRCVRRTAGALGVVLASDLGAYEASGSRPEPIRWKRTRVTALPREAAVTFSDPNRDFQANTQTARRSYGTADSKLSTEIALVMSAEEGRQLADRMLWEAWTGQQTAETTLDDRWVRIEPGRAYYFETPAGFEPLRVIRATRGWNGVLEVELRRDRDEVYQSTASGVPAEVPPNNLRLPGLTELFLLDIPLLLDADNAEGAGFYWGVVGSGDGWRGADFLRALSVSSTYSNVSPQGFELTAGTGGAALAAPTAGFDSETGWDMANTLRVTLRRPDMTLESLSDAEVIAGGNAAWVGPAGGHGGEIIQFATATFVSPGVYDLTRLRRGQRGTEFAWGSHVAGETFVHLEPGPLQRANFGVEDLALSRAYKAVSLLTLEADTPAVVFTNTGVGLRPYSPINLVADGPSGGGDVALTWVRRSRIGNSEDPPPLAENEERYTLRIMNAAGTVIVRTVDLTTPAFTYTAAMQTADFGAPVTSLRWRVAQVSAVVGNGPFAESSGPV
ncbi:MAG: phage tail protein, partial [Brevundimonas sp.]